MAKILLLASCGAVFALAANGVNGETAIKASTNKPLEHLFTNSADNSSDQQSTVSASTNRPSTWAQPIHLAGVPNLNKISEGIYRSAQPTAEGVKGLKALGIKTIINLRTFHSDRDEIGKTDIRQEDINMTAWHPEQEDAVQFLKMVTDPGRLPVLFHCQHGSDRTGTMCAVYRIAVQGWTKEEAIQEMIQGGYGFHAIWTNLPKWINELDIGRLCTDAGIKTPQRHAVR